MKPRYERPGVPGGTTFTCFTRRDKAFGFAWHFHQEYELTLITVGSGTRYVGTSVEGYLPGDLVLLGPELPHTYASGERSEAAVTQFRHDFLGAGFFDLPQFAAIRSMLNESARGLYFGGARQELRAEIASLPRLAPAVQTVRLLGVLQCLAADGVASPITGAGYAAAPSSAVRDRVDVVCRYLQEAHTEPVVLDEVAALVHMAPTSFSRFFRRAIGCTLTDYVNQLRVETACRLLTTTALPVTEVAARSGYRNLANFNRRFRELKAMQPSQYRAAHQVQPVKPAGLR
ncbi:AraC family transcriptional regulator [Kribbella sp. NPDC048915]|uniref:AraC family transcriptional regulator n=1 Tax=Kribbella sp. NPDC048915 TaxID=3155148 RepID=UPI0033EB00BE